MESATLKVEDRKTPPALGIEEQLPSIGRPCQRDTDLMARLQVAFSCPVGVHQEDPPPVRRTGHVVDIGDLRAVGRPPRGTRAPLGNLRKLTEVRAVRANAVNRTNVCSRASRSVSVNTSRPSAAPASAADGRRFGSEGDASCQPPTAARRTTALSHLMSRLTRASTTLAHQASGIALIARARTSPPASAPARRRSNGNRVLEIGPQTRGSSRHGDPSAIASPRGWRVGCPRRVARIRDAAATAGMIAHGIPAIPWE